MKSKVKLISTPEAFKKSQLSPVSQGLSPILTVGKIFGILPIRSFTKPPIVESLAKGTTPGKKRIAGKLLQLIYPLYSLCANLLIFMFAIIIFFRELGSSEENLVEQFLDIVYHCHILVTIVTCVYQSRQIPIVLEEWDQVEILLKAYECNEKNQFVFQKVILLPAPFQNQIKSLEFCSSQLFRIKEKNPHQRFSRLSTTVTVTYVLCIFGGAVSYFCSILVKDNSETIWKYLDEVAKVYVIEEACDWWTGAYVLFIGHIMELIWAYGDMLILSVSLTLWYQFKRFNKIMNTSCSKGTLSPSELENLRLVHWAVCRATKKTGKMLNVLTTTVFICNILYLFSRVFTGLEEDLNHPNWFIKFEAVYAFSYLIIRIFATAILATKFSTESVGSFQSLSRSEFWGRSEIHYLLTDRFCTQLLTSNVAISGSGYFYVNRGFISTLISALITYEVVILQFSAAAHQKSNSPEEQNSTLI